MKMSWLVKGYIIFLSIVSLSFFSCMVYAEKNGEEIKNTLLSAKQIAISIDTVPDEFVIAVSPVRQTLQIIHTSARLIGALVSETQNEKYRKDLQAVVGELNGHLQFREAILNILKSKLSAEIVEVPSLGSTAKYANDREAQLDRMKQLHNKGFDVLIDLKITCGIYGPDGEMFFRWDGKLYDLAKEKTLWRGESVVTPSADFKVNQTFNTYFNPFKSNMFSPRLKTTEDALTRWTNNNGENFKKAQEYGIQLSISHLLGALQLDKSENYYFACGISKLLTKKWKQAVPHFEKAWNLNKDNPTPGNAYMVALFKAKKIDDAIKVGEEVIQSPNGKSYPTTYYNL
ncbi:MAG TPA: tetratricopeptide repeat protein, partial [Candidatus Hydrogenedens sp.]|nr:tetratricopeptide repeat protein [Candidatus Hydrogenedens sp.]